MIKATTMLLGATLILGTATGLAAGVDERQKRQGSRIREGVRSGELTRGEVRGLGREQARIRRHEARAKSDGEFSTRERVRIHRELNRSSRHIYRQKHDDQKRN